MEIRLADHLVERLFEIGQAIDIGRPTFVFDGGEVRIVQHETDKEKENESQGTRGPQPGSRQGPAGSRRSPGKTGDSVGSVWPEWLVNDGVSLLLESYPGSRVHLDPSGCWLKVPLCPLGQKGPRALVVIALPKSKNIHPRCWAFWIETTGLRWIGPRHTNYPHGDACAFPQFEGFWDRKAGIRPYVDIHAEWLIRQLHHSVLQRWVGRQMSPFALYALNQFASVEQCHCRSGRRYGECCQPQDYAEFSANPTGQVKIALKFTRGRWFNSQEPPIEVVEFALGQRPADLVIVYRWFKELVRFADRVALFKNRLLGSSGWAGMTEQPLALRIAA